MIQEDDRFCVRMRVRIAKMVPPARFQRATFRLGGGRSMQLSYGSTSEGIVMGESVKVKAYCCALHFVLCAWTET